MTNEEQGAARLPGGISRRTLAAGAAWSVPVIAVASAAPAYAKSGDIIQFSKSSACKIPGNSQGGLCYDKGYVLWAFLQYSVPIYVKINSLTVDGDSQCIVGIVEPTTSCSTAVTNCVLIPTSGKYIGIYSNSNTNSGSGLVEVGFTWSTSSSTCASGTSKVESANLTGGSWTSGGGSCNFPPGASCTTPLSAASTPCATC